MAPLEQRIIRHDLFQNQKMLSHLEQQFGKHSPQYQEALTNVRRLWALLQMTHSKEDFLSSL